MQPLQDSIRGKLIPAVTKHQPNDLELEMLSLPAAYGGMIFDDPVADSRRKHSHSTKCTATVTDLICAVEPCLPSGSTDDPDRAAKAAVRRQHQLNLTLMADAVQARMSDQLRRAMMVAREKGASSTLTTIPVAENGFFFDVKSDFHDHMSTCGIAGRSTTCRLYVRVGPGSPFTKRRSASLLVCPHAP